MSFFLESGSSLCEVAWISCCSDTFLVSDILTILPSMKMKFRLGGIGFSSCQIATKSFHSKEKISFSLGCIWEVGQQSSA